MTKNLTVGNPALLILSFTVPLLIGNLFQQFYNMADAFIVGRTIGVQALAAVGCTGSIGFFILGFLLGFTQGASIITSQRFGAGDMAGVRRSFAASLVLGIGMTIVITALSVTDARPLLVLLRTPEEILEGACLYIVIIFWGIGAAVLFNVFSGVMRAVGDSRTPLIFLVIACIINIILDFVFILVFHTGVKGAAYATIIAQLLSGLCCIPVIIKKLPMLLITREDWKFDKAEMSIHLKVALPVGFQMSIIAIGALGLQFALNGLGTVAVAAFTAAQKIEQFAMMPMSSFGAAMTTYAAQNYGARKVDRIRKGIIQCCGISGSIAIVMSVLFIIFGQSLAAIFIVDNPEAIALARTFLVINGSCYVILAIMFIFRQTIQGLGQSLVPTIAGVMELVMRLFAAIILSERFGFTGACFASPLAWLGALIPVTIAVVLVLKDLRRKALGEWRAFNTA
jgi:putative MATE family efflux protein